MFERKKFNNIWEGRILRETGKNLFIDSKLWTDFLDFCEKRLDKKILEG